MHFPVTHCSTAVHDPHQELRRILKAVEQTSRIAQVLRKGLHLDLTIDCMRIKLSFYSKTTSPQRTIAIEAQFRRRVLQGVQVAQTSLIITSQIRTSACMSPSHERIRDLVVTSGTVLVIAGVVQAQAVPQLVRHDVFMIARR